MDTSKYCDRVLQIDPERRLAVVEAGCVLDDLRAAAEHHHLTFGPDPSTHNHNTLGGMIGSNSCGVHSVMAGRTADNLQEIARRVSGYNLPKIPEENGTQIARALVGSEGTCGFYSDSAH